MRKTLAALILLLTLFGFLTMEMRTGSSSDPKAVLDVFTQKTPFSGRGLNVSSDVFSPQEVVVLYAIVTFDTLPVKNSLVLFHMTLPDATTFSLTAETDSTGIASVDFTIMTPPANLTSNNGIFGDWQVQANTLVDSVVVFDILIFKVDWIVKLLSLRTVDGNLTYRSSFGIGGEVGFELSLRNIAMTTKKATLTLTLKDELDFVINSSEVVDFEVQPNETVEFIYLKLSIPKSASIGNATVEANALTAPTSQNGVPYCPHVTAGFSIAIAEPLAIMLHDASLVGIFSSTRSAHVGDTLTLDVKARNDGTEPESFNVTAYFGDVMIGTLQITGLTPYSSILLNYTVDTSGLGLGTYTTAASISSLPNEADLSDNTISGDAMDILPQAPIYVHDIGITNITLSSLTVHVGESVQINVTLTNKGNASESFSVRAYYDLVLIASAGTNDLQPMNNRTLVFTWDTDSLNRTVYQIRAVAHLVGDANPSDNTLIDGSVNLVEPLSSYFVLDWFDGLLIFAVILLAVLLVALLLLRRSKKKDEESRSH